MPLVDAKFPCRNERLYAGLITPRFLRTLFVLPSDWLYNLLGQLANRVISGAAWVYGEIKIIEEAITNMASSPLGPSPCRLAVAKRLVPLARFDARTDDPPLIEAPGTGRDCG